MSFSQAKPILRVRAAGHRGHQQSVGQGMEVEAAIEAIGDGAEVALGVLAVAEGMVGTAEAAFYVAEDRVYPVEHGSLVQHEMSLNRSQLSNME